MYVHPTTICSPKGLVTNVRIIYDKGPDSNSWFVAKLDWAGNKSVGIRCNGTSGDEGIGTPESRDIATWFIVPEELAEAVVNTAASLKRETVMWFYGDTRRWLLTRSAKLKLCSGLRQW